MKVLGSLDLVNSGTAEAGGFTINYYLSADATLDPGDSLVGTRPAPLVPPDKRRSVDFSFSSSSPVSGMYLIASVTSTNPENGPDVVVAGPIP